MEKDSISLDFQRIVDTYLRSSVPSSNALYLMLYILYARVHGIKTEDIFDQNCKTRPSLSSMLDTTPGYILSALWGKSEYEWLMRNEPTYTVSLCGEMYDFLKNHNEVNFVENYPSFVERIISTMLYMGGREAGFFLSVPEIVNLVSSIASSLEPHAIYDPFAGVCSFAVTPQLKQIPFTGQDFNRDMEVLSMVRLEASGRSNFRFWYFNSFSTLKDIESHDTLVSEPPFNMRLPRDFRDMCPSLTSDEYIFRVFINTPSLQKAVFILPSTICHSNKFEMLRRELIERNYVTSIISLPEKIIPYTGIRTCVYVLDKGRVDDTIRFIDAKDMFKASGRLNILDWEQVFNVYRQGSSHPRVCRDVPRADIDKEGGKLSPSFYTLDDTLDVPEGSVVVSLDTLIAAERLSLTNKKSGKVLSGGDFQSSRIGKIIKPSNIENIEFGEGNYFEITGDSIVFPAQRPELACFLEKGEEPIFSKSRMLSCYTVKSENVYPMYLIGELSKPYFRKQLERFSIGSVMRFNTETVTRDFLACKIVLPTLEIQREIYIKEQMDALRAEGITVDTIAEERVNNIMLNQRQKKHAVSQVLADMLPALGRVLDCVNSGENISKDTVVSRRSGRTLGEYLQVIYNDADRVSRMVDKFTTLEKYGIAEDIPVCTTIEEYCHAKIDDTFKTQVVGIETDDGEGIDVFVHMWRDAFVQMLDNLFDNAKKYGFVDSDTKNYIIRVQVNLIETEAHVPSVEIIVANNGEPVSKSIALDKLFVWGVGKGSGIGCNQVKEIAEHYDGSVSYKEYPDDAEGFCSEFKIVLPIISE